MREGSEKENPLRVIQVCYLQAGGISAMILAVCAHLDREKVNFDYLVYRNQEEFWESRALELGGRKLVADNTEAGNKAEKFLLKFVRIYQVLKKEKAVIFHINAPTPYDCLAGIAARLAGVKTIILHSHNSQLKKEGRGHRIFQGICRMLLPLCGDYYFACSDLAGEFMFGKRPRKNIIYVKNGIATEHFRFDGTVRRKMREQYGIANELVAGSIGRFCGQKNQKFLMEIFAEILKLRPESFLLLIGQGELEDELMETAEELEIRDRLIHIAATERVAEYLCMMDVFLLPSLFEGLPVVGVEAQASGLPCVFSGSITRQAALTDRACFLDLNHPAREWAQFALKEVEKCREGREEYWKKVKKAGYEIADTAGWLQEFYLDRQEDRKATRKVDRACTFL